MARSLALSILALGALGCSHLHAPFRPVQGQDFSAENLDQIHEGMAAVEALRLLGEPLERTSTDKGERWRYYLLEERVDEKRLLGITTVRRWRWERWIEAELLVENGSVIEVSYDSKVMLPSGETAKEQQAGPSPEAIARAPQETKDARRQLEEQVRRDREEMPRGEDTLPGGKVQEFARQEMEEAIQLCRAAPRRFVEAEVELDTTGEVQSVELRTGSGEQGCDRAVIRALQASRWMSCQGLGEPAPCRVSYALSLGSPLH